MNNKEEKVGYTVYPKETLSMEQWMKEFKVGILHVDKQAMYNAKDMMKQYDSNNTFYSKLRGILNRGLCVN